jgi:SAM-dependent methyltransferase
VCESPPGRTLYRSRFDEQPIRDVLFRLYGKLTPDGLDLLRNGEYVLERCPSCTLVWQRFVPDDALYKIVYSWIDVGLERQDTLEWSESAVEEILLVLHLLDRSPSEVSVLDFGMGWGRWARLARALGCNASGTEPVDELAEHARENGVRVLELDGLADAAFQFVNSEQVFEHLVDPRRPLRRLAGALADDGWLKISVPQGNGIEARLRKGDWSAPRRTAGSLVAVAPLDHVNCFTTRALEALGEQAGLARQTLPARPVLASTVGLWPARRLARGTTRPFLRRVRPKAAWFRHSIR